MSMLSSVVARIKTDLVMHRVTEESGLTKSADGSIARRAEAVGLDRDEAAMYPDVVFKPCQAARGVRSSLKVPSRSIAQRTLTLLLARAITA